MCPYRRLARGTASARFEVVMQSAFLEKVSYTMAIQSMLAFAVANEMGRERFSVLA